MDYKTIIIVAFIFMFDYSTCFSFRCFNKTNLEHGSTFNKYPSLTNGRTYEYFDWRDQGAVSPVKDQISCAPCNWAFAIASHLESLYKLRYDWDVSVSVQFLLNCLGYNAGWQPGNMFKSLAEVTSTLSGVLAEPNYYSYAALQMVCKWNGDKQYLLPVVGARRVPHDMISIIEALVRQGPLIAGINSQSMKLYTTGIDEPTDDNCDPNKLDHVVLIVGYNYYVHPTTHRIVLYWIIKNSKGTSWGDNGFYYLVRGRNACGIESAVTHAFVQ